MKKVLFIILFTLLLLLIPVTVFADEEVVEEPEPPVEVEPVEVETEPTLDDFKLEVENYLSQYMEESMVAKIITWLIDAGVLTALFAVYLKYRKYKHTTIEDLLTQFKDKMGVWLKENFDKLSAEEIAKLENAIDNLEKSNETIMKVLVLSQDNTAKGKAALIEYLGSKTDSKEVKEAATQVTETLEEQEKVKNEVNEKVAGEYKEIF